MVFGADSSYRPTNNLPTSMWKSLCSHQVVISTDGMGGRHRLQVMTETSCPPCTYLQVNEAGGRLKLDTKASRQQSLGEFRLIPIGYFHKILIKSTDVHSQLSLNRKIPTGEALDLTACPRIESESVGVS